VKILVLATLAPERAQLSVENIQYPNVHDTSPARADLDFHFTVSVLDGMRRTIAWLADHHQIEDSAGDEQYERIIGEWRRAMGALAREARLRHAAGFR